MKASGFDGRVLHACRQVGASRLGASQASGPVGVQKAKTPAEAEAQAGDEAAEKAEREPAPVAA